MKKRANVNVINIFACFTRVNRCFMHSFVVLLHFWLGLTDRTPYRLATIFFSYINTNVGAKRVIYPRELFNVSAEHDLTVI